MTEAPEWEWRQLDASAYEHLDGLDGYGAYALGEKVAIVICQRDEDDPATRSWMVYYVMYQQREGFSGLESIDGRDSLEEAKSMVEEDRDRMIQMVREDPL